MTIDEKSIEKFKVLPGVDALGVPVGTRDYRIAGVLRKFAKTQRAWALANSHVSSAQTRFNVLHHCLRTTFTHLIRALGPEIFGSRLERKHFEECNEHIRKTNEEDSKEGNFMLLKEVVMPAGPTSLGKYIDDWLSREAMSVTGIPVTAIPIEDQIRFTYPRREGVWIY